MGPLKQLDDGRSSLRKGGLSHRDTSNPNAVPTRRNTGDVQAHRLAQQTSCFIPFNRIAQPLAGNKAKSADILSIGHGRQNQQAVCPGAAAGAQTRKILGAPQPVLTLHKQSTSEHPRRGASKGLGVPVNLLYVISLNSKLMPSTFTPRLDHVAAALALHTPPEAMHPSAAADLRLIRPLGHFYSPTTTEPRFSPALVKLTFL